MTTVPAGQTLSVSSGQTLVDLLVSGTAVVSSGGVVDFAQAVSSGLVAVVSGGSASQTTVASGGVLYDSGGVDSLTTVSSGGGILISAGQSLSAQVYGGVLEEDMGLESGAFVTSAGYELVRGSASGDTAADGAEIIVYGFANGLGPGSASGETLVSSGLEVLSGGRASSATATLDGGVVVSNGGVVSADIVSNYGFEVVSTGGVAAAVTVGSSGLALVSSGGELVGGVIQSGGYLVLRSGAIDVGTAVLSGGSVEFGQAPLSGSEVLTGYKAVTADVVSSGVEIAAGAYAQDMANEVASGGVLHLNGDNVGGGLDVDAGGVAIGPGGIFASAHIRGVISKVTLSGGYNGMTVESGGAAVSVTVSSGATLIIDSGGLASGARISSGGKEIVSWGGSAAGGVVVSGGEIAVSSAGVVSGLDLQVGARIGVIDGSATAVTVDSAGHLSATSGGQTLLTLDLVDVAPTDEFILQDNGALIVVSSGAPPSLVAPAALTLQQGLTTPVSGVKLAQGRADPDQTYTVIVSARSAVLTASGAYRPSNTDVVLYGSLQQVNAALATLQASEASPGYDTLTISVTDSHGTPTLTRTLPIATDGPLALVAPASATATLGAATSLPGLGVGDSILSPTPVVTLTLADNKGRLNATGAGVHGGGTTNLVISGSLTQVRADLATLTLTETGTGPDVLRVSASDDQGDVALVQKVAISTPGAPVLAAPVSAALTAGSATAVHGVRLSEASPVAGETFEVTLSDGSGRLSVQGPGVTGSGKIKVTVSGSLAQVDQELASLKITETGAGPDTLRISASDSVGGIAAPIMTLLSITPSAQIVQLAQIGASLGQGDLGPAGTFASATSGASPVGLAAGHG